MIMKLTLGKSLFLITLIIILFLPTHSKIQKLKQKERELSQKVERLKIENENLADENRMLKTDPVYIEEVAREKLKVARENEIVFRVVDEDDSKE